MNYNTILASLLDGISLALKSGNSNVDAEQFNFLTDAINRSTIIPSYFDRENAIKYLDVSDTEFARLTYKGTKFHPVQPLLSPVRVQGMTKPVYLKETLDALKNNGLIRPMRSRSKSFPTGKKDSMSLFLASPSRRARPNRSHCIRNPHCLQQWRPQAKR